MEDDEEVGEEEEEEEEEEEKEDGGDWSVSSPSRLLGPVRRYRDSSSHSASYRDISLAQNDDVDDCV